ncbi:hypothetical protein N0K08_16735 [Acidovorax sp. Be4]|uniref:Uncharacterized protein n=1 Tax=Acidovorax bellezanensis TaxID=2976702 RepID=A0ABT2PPA0_9BURK|nr:hypothetical protein [Acidovorax sp. Be4]MCT9812291.1 hypothetical protein [Acidovorax sp. Be4]
MSEVEKIESVSQCEVISSFYTAKCASISGQSTLTYEIGKNGARGGLHLRIARNTGGGMWCKDWAAFEAIEAIVIGSKELKAKSFHCLHPGKSINTGGFVLAALRDLGLIRPSEANTRLHEHVPMTTLELVLQNPPKAKGSGDAALKSHRKAKGGA